MFLCKTCVFEDPKIFSKERGEVREFRNKNPIIFEFLHATFNNFPLISWIGEQEYNRLRDSNCKNVSLDSEDCQQKNIMNIEYKRRRIRLLHNKDALILKQKMYQICTMPKQKKKINGRRSVTKKWYVTQKTKNK